MKKFSGDEITISFVINILGGIQDDILIYHHVDVCEGDSWYHEKELLLRVPRTENLEGEDQNQLRLVPSGRTG